MQFVGNKKIAIYGKPLTNAAPQTQSKYRDLFALLILGFKKWNMRNSVQAFVSDVITVNMNN